MGLSVEAIHPNLEKTHDKLMDVACDQPGIFAEFPDLLSLYLRTQLKIFAVRDVMFAYDISGKPAKLLDYAREEMKELKELVPIFSANNDLKKLDPIKSSMEGGDVVWFLAMWAGLSYLEPKKKTPKSEMNFAVGILGIIKSLSTIYPGFQPEKYADQVAKKNQANYPDRVLRAEPQLTVSEMAGAYKNGRLPHLKALRGTLYDRKIPKNLYVAIQNGVTPMPVVRRSLPEAKKRYEEVINLAHTAPTQYAYQSHIYDSALGWIPRN